MSGMTPDVFGIGLGIGVLIGMAPGAMIGYIICLAMRAEK